MITHQQTFIPLMVTSGGVLKLSPHHENALWELLPKDRFEFMQWTGKQDKNKRDVYDGDVIEFDREVWGGDDNIHLVKWDDEEASWCFGSACASDMEYRKVIGNIYENPNFLNL